MREVTRRDEAGNTEETPEKETEASSVTRACVQSLVEQVFLGQPLLVLEDAEGRRYRVDARGSLWWEDDMREDTPPLRAVERNIEVKLNELLGRLVALEGLEPDPTVDCRFDLASGLVTTTVCLRDVVATLNNVALAKHALAIGHLEAARLKLDNALSWCGPMLGVDHPAIDGATPGDEAAPGESARLLDPRELLRRAAQGK